MDVLTLTREFVMKKKEILTEGDNFVFGEFCWPKNTRTNFLKWGTGDREGKAPKDYYTLEAIVFLLHNVDLPFALYMREAVYANVPAVRLADRKDLLAFLQGHSPTCEAIDKGAPFDLALRTIQLHDKRSGEGGAGDRKRLWREWPRRGEGREAGGDRGMGYEPPTPHGGPPSLQEAMSMDRINAIKRKRLANKQTRSKGEGEGGATVGLETRRLREEDADVTQDILNKERSGRTRNSVLRSNGKQFAKDVFSILQSVKAREEGEQRHLQTARPRTSAVTHSKPHHPASYSRYDQEKFKGKEETESFQIDTMGTYHGMTLKSVTEGMSAKPPPSSASLSATSPSTLTLQADRDPKSPLTRPVPSQKRISKTPIIVIPASGNALISMLNAKDILQDLRYVSAEDKRGLGQKRESELLIQRTKEGGVSIPYRVIDNPLRLALEDWERVVAVFVQGPAWQFKGWPWGGDPVEIFSNIPGFHLKWSELPLDDNVRKWAVTVIALDRHRRHWDRANLQTIWEKLDRHMSKSKPFLRW